MSFGEILFYVGLSGMAAVIIAAVVTVILFSVRKKRLKNQLDNEYGVEHIRKQ